MLYVTLLFLLFAAAFGVSGISGMTSVAAAPVHTLFFISMIALMVSLAGSLFRRR